MTVPTPDPRVVYAAGLLGKLKAVAALLAPVAVLVQSAITDGTITTDEWYKIAVAVLGAVAVYFTPNKTVPVQVK